MSHPFFDCTGEDTFSPGDYGIFQPSMDSYAHVQITRTKMYVNREGRITPHVFYSRNGVDCCRESQHVAKCISYMGDQYAPIWYFVQIVPYPGEDVVVWSKKLSRYVPAVFLHCSDGIAKIEYRPGSYEVPYTAIYRLVQNILFVPTEI